MKITFESGSYSLRSLFCALLLAFASFSILPLSVALLPAEKKTESELVRVYSQAENFPEKTANAAVPSASLRVAAPSGVRGEPSSVDAPPLDFSAVGVFAPNLSSNADLNLSDFGGTALPREGTGIATFELASLDKIPRRLNNVAIKYPPDLLRRGIEGEVRLSVIIDESGNLSVESVESSTDKAFEANAVAAASKLKYEPPTKNGRPVRAKFVLPIPFKIIQ